MKIAYWYEICKLIWELQSNSHVLVYSFYMDVCNFHMRHSGNENLFWNRMFWFNCGVDDKNSTKQSLAKPPQFVFQYQFPCWHSLILILSHDSSALRKRQHNLPWTKPLCFVLCANCCVLCLIVLHSQFPLLRCWQHPCRVACGISFAHVPLSRCLQHTLPPVACSI